MEFTEVKLKELEEYLFERVMFNCNTEALSLDFLQKIIEEQHLKINNFLSFLQTLDPTTVELKDFLVQITNNPGKELHDIYLTLENSTNTLGKYTKLDLKLTVGTKPMTLKINLRESLFCINWPEYGFNDCQNWKHFNVLQDRDADTFKIKEICVKKIAYDFAKALYSDVNLIEDVSTRTSRIWLFDAFVAHALLQLPQDLACALKDSIDHIKTFNQYEFNKPFFSQVELNKSFEFYFNLLLPELVSVSINLPDDVEEFVTFVENKFEIIDFKDKQVQKHCIKYIRQSLKSDKIPAYVNFESDLKKVLAYSVKHGNTLPIKTFYLLMDIHGLERRPFENFSSCIDRLSEYLDAGNDETIANLMLQNMPNRIDAFFTSSENNEPLRKYFLTEFKQEFEKHLRAVKCDNYIRFLGSKIPDSLNIQFTQFINSYIPLLKDIRIFKTCFETVVFPNQQMPEQFTQEDLVKYLEATSIYCQKTELMDGFSDTLKDIAIDAFDRLSKGKSFSMEILKRIIDSIQVLPYKQELIDKFEKLPCIADQNNQCISQYLNAQATFSEIKSELFDKQKILTANSSSQKPIFSKIFFIFGILLATIGAILFMYINSWLGIGLIAFGLTLVLLGIYTLLKKSKVEVLNQNDNEHLDENNNIQSIKLTNSHLIEARLKDYSINGESFYKDSNEVQKKISNINFSIN